MTRKVIRSAVVEPGPFEGDELYSPEEVAGRIKVPLRRVRDWYYRGEFGSGDDIVMLPSGWRVYGRAVNRFLDGHSA